MKILAIRGKNLASIDGDFEIDFTREPLLSAGIFAITGPTGSGKSTLLDAMCLALFAKSPRQSSVKSESVTLSDGETGNISQNGPRAILRKGTAEGYAEVEFAGLDGNLYSAEWRVRRARNRPSGNLQEYTHRLTNLSSNVPVSDKKTETQNKIVDLIGLNYDQFTRSVMLAQGDFTAFLKADRDDKAALLEKLTGTDIYSKISIHIFNKAKEANAGFVEIQNRIKDIILLNEEEVLELKKQEKEADNQLKEAEKKKDLLLKEKNWHLLSEQLTESAQQAEQAYIKADTDQSSAAERVVLLKQIEAVQPLRELVNTRNEKRRKMIGLEKEKLVAEEKAKSFEEILDKLKIEGEGAENARKEAERNISDAAPRLRKASELDTLLKTSKDVIGSTRNDLDKAVKKRDNEENLLKEHRKNLQKVTKQLETVSKWLEENRKRAPLSENFPLIEEGLTNAAKLKEEGFDLGKEKAEIIDQIRENKDVTSELESLLKNTVDEMIEPVEKIKHLHETVETAQPENLEKKAREASDKIQLLTEAGNCWEKFYETRASLANQEKEINRLTQNIETYKAENKKNSIEQNEAEISRKQTQKLVEQLTLRTTENVETLRSRLTEGQPCPVCGSHEHPFATGDLGFHTAISEFQKELELLNSLYDKKLQRGAALLEQISQSEKTINVLRQEVEQSRNRFEELRLQWDGFILSEKIAEADDEVRQDVIKDELENVKIELQEFAKQLETCRFQKLELEKEKSRLEKLKEKKQSHERQIVKYINDKNVLVERLEHREKRNNDIKNEIEVILNRFNVWFVQPDWVEKWSENPKSFIEKLRNFNTDWLNQTRLQIDLGRKSESMAERIPSWEKLVADYQENCDKNAIRLKQLEEEETELRKQRNLIFNGKPVSVVETELNQALVNVRKSVEEITNEVKENQSELDKLKGNLTGLKVSLKQAANEKMASETVFESGLSRLNSDHGFSLDEPGLLVLLQCDLQWINSEKVALQELKDAVLTAKTTLGERKTQLEKHNSQRISDRGKDLVLGDLEDNEVVITEITRKKTELGFKLRQNEENRKKSGELLKELAERQKSWKNWEKLNSILGSADGKKFRQIAQEYTLEVLLGFANIHLKELSGRYELQVIPDSLALQVVDHDMGDETRSVHSLSGGESFLVSLALALGLASLSSHRMKIESLFIDEGFGSLDPTTLNIAMDALEQLHNQGRKVGVISHVQEMTERILTKIEVEKLSGGRSRIVISGN